MDLPKAFKIYLAGQGVSPVTIKNYLSDFNHFWGWLILDLRSRGLSTNFSQEIVGQLSPRLIEKYKEFLVKNQIPPKTINRRLSTLRRLGDFCLQQGWLKANPAQEVVNLPLQEKVEIENAEAIIAQFRAGLEKEKVSPLTIKNYLSDVRHFLAWLEVEV